MVGMTVVLVVGAIAVVGAVLLGVTWRRGGDERHSVSDYHQTIETLRHLAERNAANGVRGSSASSGSSSGAGVQAGPRNGSGGALAPTAARSGTLISRSGGPGRAAFQDDSPASVSAPSGGSASSTVSQVALRRAFYQRRRGGLPSGRPEISGRGILVAAVVVALIALVAVGVAIAPSHPSHKKAGSTASSSATSASNRSSNAGTPATRPGSSSGGRRPTTTVPSSLQATTSSTTSADYQAPGTSYTLTLSASGACWVLAQATSSGSVLWTGTLEAGQTQQILATGSVSLRLGAAFVVNVSVNRVPVVLPSDHGSPFDLNFQVA